MRILFQTYDQRKYQIRVLGKEYSKTGKNDKIRTKEEACFGLFLAEGFGE